MVSLKMNVFMMQKSNAKNMMFNYSLLKKDFLDYILLTIHYARNSRCCFLIKNIKDLEEVVLYLETAILWP